MIQNIISQNITMHQFGGGQKQLNPDGLYQKKYYSLRAVHTKNSVLDICQDGPLKGQGIIWEGYGGDNQCWTIIKEQHYWLFKSKSGNNQFLTVENEKLGAKLILAPRNNTPNQHFIINQKNGSKDHVIMTFANLALDVCEDKKQNGTKVIQHTYNGNKNQLWNFCDPKKITDSSSDND